MPVKIPVSPPGKFWSVVDSGVVTIAYDDDPLYWDCDYCEPGYVEGDEYCTSPNSGRSDVNRFRRPNFKY